jgi:ABC-type nitrate/sulfonate/bicarbonate transport system permease component
MNANLIRLAVYGPAVILWEILARAAERPTRIPCPLGIGEVLVEKISDGVLQTAVVQSFSRIMAAVVIATLIGLAAGSLMGWFRWADRALSPISDALRSIAPIAWIPMAILWFGISGGATIFIVAYAAVFPVTLNTAQAVRSIEIRYIQAARVLGARPFYLFRRVVLREALPTVIVGIRIGMGFAWASIVAAELALGIKLDSGTQLAMGLGQLMVEKIFFDPNANELALYMLVVGIVAIVIDKSMRWLYWYVSPWETA